MAYCAAKGYQVHQVVKEMGTGVNESRPEFLKLLVDPRVTVIVVEHKDRVTRFGFRYVPTAAPGLARCLPALTRWLRGLVRPYQKPLSRSERLGDSAYLLVPAS